MSLQMMEYWIFDLDGTLSKPTHDFGALRAKLSLNADDDILGAVATAAPQTASEMRKVIAQWEWDEASRAEPADGVHEYLETLIGKGCKLGIVTRNLKSIALETLKRIDCLRFFNTSLIIDRESCEPKPSPNGILHCLELMDAVGPSTFVGDYVHDLQAGRMAGCYTILRGPTLPPSWSHLTDLWIREFSELSQQLND